MEVAQQIPSSTYHSLLFIASRNCEGEQAVDPGAVVLRIEHFRDGATTPQGHTERGPDMAWAESGQRGDVGGRVL